MRTNISEFRLDIDIEGFSGPFDLLCSLVESRQFQISEIKISQLVKIYGLYLVKTRQAPADTLAEFFYMTAGLLLEKAKSLLPGAKPITESENEIPNEENFMKSLERYKPYRKAYQWLSEKFDLQSKSFRRDAPEPVVNIHREIVVDDDGVYILAKTWKNLHAQHDEYIRTIKEFEASRSGADWDGFAKDDQKQIQARISELEEQLNIAGSLSFNEVCQSRRSLVITLLALLELCRMGKASIEQKELFSDVRIVKS
ncbi:MAG: segregation/condensation protein A [Synergistaceae bacterium]|nr:segregation/condensation protein A [Synergistaceae bacterium]